MIPKILHFVWLGPLKIPTTVKLWEKMHPGWKVIIWNEERISKLSLINDKIYNLDTKRYNQKSDIIRLEVLYRYGGVYVDVDIVSLLPIDSLLTKRTELFLVQEKLGLVSNSVIGSTKKNNIILKIIKQIKNEFDVSESVWKSTGPGLLTNFLVNNNLIRIPASHTKYDIISRVGYLRILPYYSCNLMSQVIKLCRDKQLTEDIIRNTERNKDLKYIIHNNIDNDLIFGVQLWMGGKDYNYKNIIDINLVKRNFFFYIQMLK
jgi:hypothetical protein